MKQREAAAIGLSVTVLGAVLLSILSGQSASPVAEALLTPSRSRPSASPPTAAATPVGLVAGVDTRPLIMPETNGPITYYVTNCARCHGDASAAYEGLKNPKRGAALKQIIDDMAQGPGNAPLDEAGLNEQVRLHEAMFDHKPYAWIDPGVKDRVVGEKLENTTVTNEATAPARIDGYRFVLPVTAGNLNIRPAQLTNAP